MRKCSDSRCRRRTLVCVNASNSDGKRAVIVGAGPAGTVAALILGRHGFDVQVLISSESG